MTHVDYMGLLKLVAPETALVIVALVVLVLDLGLMRGETQQNRFSVGTLVAVFGCAIAGALAFGGTHEAARSVAMLAVDPVLAWVKLALIVLAAMTVLVSASAKFTDHVGEYIALILLSTVGMMFLVSSNDLLLVFISLELTSLSLYILTAFNKTQAKSAEAALKYFLFGGVAAAITLFGISLIYGIAGSTDFKGIAAGLHGRELDPLTIVALVMTAIGFGFKIAAVPFHLWAPDAYEGAPTPSAALIASGSKVASFVVLARLMMLGFDGTEGSAGWREFATGWGLLLAVMAAFSMVLGNLVAIAQTNVKRLLAYSAVAHAGYALLAIVADSQHGFSALVYYVITYGATALGAFAVVSVVEQRTGGSRLTDFAGLGRQEPLVAFCMMIFILSLAGIPPLAGFFGKFYVFAAAIAVGHLSLLWLVALAIAMSAVSLFYYLQVLKQVYVAEAPADASNPRVPFTSRVALVLLAAAVIILGCAPDLLLGRLAAVVNLAAH